jgi:hypothetical protein
MSDREQDDVGPSPLLGSDFVTVKAHNAGEALTITAETARRAFPKAVD